jgi:hypothetical protein
MPKDIRADNHHMRASILNAVILSVLVVQLAGAAVRLAGG